MNCQDWVKTRQVVVRRYRLIDKIERINGCFLNIWVNVKHDCKRINNYGHKD